MTLLEQPVQDHQKVAGSGPTSPPDSGNPLTQMTVGPAALAQLMIFKSIALYQLIIKDQAEQKKNSVKAQQSLGVGAYNETIDSGNAAFKYACIAGGLTIAGAGLSIVAMGAAQKLMNRGSNAKMKVLEKETAPLDAIEKELGVGAAGKMDAGDAVKVPKQSDLIDAAGKKTTLGERYEEFKGGDYSNGNESPQNTRDAIALIRDDEGEYANFESKFLKKLDAKREQMHDITRRQNTTATYSNVASQTVNGVSQGGSGIAQGTGQQQQQQHNAASELDKMSSQMAGGSAGDFGQAMAKAYEAEIQELQVLAEIHRSNSVNA